MFNHTAVLLQSLIFLKSYRLIFAVNFGALFSSDGFERMDKLRMFI
jgi:hypothetical protein